MLRCAAFAENSADEVVLEFNTLSDKTHTYQVLISRPIHQPTYSSKPVDSDLYCHFSFPLSSISIIFKAAASSMTRASRE
jgi:hypothetical protein